MLEKDTMEHDELLTSLQAEERDSVNLNDAEVYQDQIDAFLRYAGRDYGNEKAGQSAVHDRTVFETIEWIRPDMSRIFTAGGNSVRVDPWEEGTDQQADDASDYLNQLFLEEMDGEGIVDAFCFDGLLQKRGVGAVYWSDAELGRPETVEGGREVLQLLEQRGAHILEVKPVNAPAEVFSISFQRIVRQARPVPRIIAPEDFRIASNATSLERPRYCGHVERIMKSDLLAEFPDQSELIEEYAESADGYDISDERRRARFFDVADHTNYGGVADPLTDEVFLYREYIFHDLDGDGYAELLEVFRLEGCILHAEPVDDNPYFSWTPVPIPHRWFGLSIFDVVREIQDIKTRLLRAAIDSVNLSVVPRVAANKKVNLSDLLTVRTGAVVRVDDDQPIGDSLRPITIPDVSGSAINMMEVVDQAGERRSGISRNAQGLDPDTLNKTYGGLQLMQNAAGVRKEQIARNLAKGIEMMFRKMYRLVIAMQEGGHTLHMGNGKFREFQPSQWAPEAKVRLHVANGTGDRNTRIAQLIQLQTGQKEFIANYGKNNPIVTLKHLYKTQEDIGREMGLRTIDPYFANPESLTDEQLAQMNAPPPDPSKAKMESEATMAKFKAELQSKQQTMKQQQDHEYRMAQLAADKEQREVEHKFKVAQANAELNLKREMMNKELALQERLALSGVKPNGSMATQVHLGGDPG